MSNMEIGNFKTVVISDTNNSATALQKDSPAKVLETTKLLFLKNKLYTTSV